MPVDVVPRTNSYLSPPGWLNNNYAIIRCRDRLPDEPAANFNTYVTIQSIIDWVGDNPERATWVPYPVEECTYCIVRLPRLGLEPLSNDIPSSLLTAKQGETMFECRIKRTKDSPLLITIKSPDVESIVKALCNGRSEQVNFHAADVILPTGVTVTAGNRVRIWWGQHEQIALSVGGVCDWNTLFMRNGSEFRVNVAPLLMQGVGSGITLRPSYPLPITDLKEYAAALGAAAEKLLSSLRPVDISVSITAQNPVELEF